MTITDVAREWTARRDEAWTLLELGADMAAESAFTEAQVAKAEILARLAALVSA